MSITHHDHDESEPPEVFEEPTDGLINGHCEDFPCCGHERGDCNGQLYGSDEDIKAQVYAKLSDPDYDPYYDESDY